MVAGAAAGLSTNAFSKVFFLLHEKSSSMNIEQLFKHCHRDLKNTHRLIILFLRDIKVNPKNMREKSKLEKPCLCSAMAIRRQRNVVVSNPTWHVGLKSFQAMQSWYFTTKNNKIYNSINSFFWFQELYRKTSKKCLHSTKRCTRASQNFPGHLPHSAYSIQNGQDHLWSIFRRLAWKHGRQEPLQKSADFKGIGDPYPHTKS